MFFKPVSPEFPWPACLSGPRTLCPTCLSALQSLEPYRQWEILIFDPSFATDCENALMLYICTLSFICYCLHLSAASLSRRLLRSSLSVRSRRRTWCRDWWHCLLQQILFFRILQKPLESSVKYQQSSFWSPHCWRMQASSLPLKSLKKGCYNLSSSRHFYDLMISKYSRWQMHIQTFPAPSVKIIFVVGIWKMTFEALVLN